MLPKGFDGINGFATGVLATLVIVLASVAVGVELKTAVQHNYLSALLTTLGAIIAGWIALFGIRSQVEHASRIEESRAALERRASVAALPLALSVLSEVSLNGIRRHFHGGDLIPPIATVVRLDEIPKETFEILINCIRHADERTAQTLGYVLSAYQILQSRDKDVAVGDRITPFALHPHPSRVEDAITWASVGSVVDMLYVVARGEEPTVPEATVDHIENFLKQAGLNLNTFSVVAKRFEDRAKLGTLHLRLYPLNK